MKFIDISLFIRPNVRSFAHKARCHTHTDLPHTQPSVAHTQPLSHTQFREIAKSNNFMFRRPLRAIIFDSQAVFVALTRNLLIWLVETVYFRYDTSNTVYRAGRVCGEEGHFFCNIEVCQLKNLCSNPRSYSLSFSQNRELLYSLWHAKAHVRSKHTEKV